MGQINGDLYCLEYRHAMYKYLCRFDISIMYMYIFARVDSLCRPLSYCFNFPEDSLTSIEYRCSRVLPDCETTLPPRILLLQSWRLS